MKRLIIISLALLLLAACTEKAEDKETKVDVIHAEEQEEAVTEQGNYFDGTVAQLEDIRIEIIETKVIPAGEGRNEADVPIFAVWYEMTNLSDKDYSTSDWVVMFDAIQDNDPNTEKTLSPGIIPEADHADTQLDKIKKDGTLQGSFSYELGDTETPVTLIASRGAWEEIGRHTYDID